MRQSVNLKAVGKAIFAEAYYNLAQQHHFLHLYGTRENIPLHTREYVAEWLFHKIGND